MALIKRDRKYKYKEGPYSIQPRTKDELESFDVIKTKASGIY